VFSVYCHILYCFYLSVLCSGLLISFVFQAVPVLYFTIVFLCLPGVHVSFLPLSSVGLRFPPPIDLYFIFLFINHILLFPSFLPLFSCLCLATAPGTISSLVERLPSKLHWLLHSLASQPVASTRLADTTLLITCHHPHFSINSVLVQPAFYWTTWMNLWSRSLVWRFAKRWRLTSLPLPANPS